MTRSLTDLLGVRHPVIMAPMFLISNMAMSRAAVQSGIAACIPALNFRHHEDLEKALQQIRDEQLCIGINLIANRSNYKLKKQLKACIHYKVPFIISSLGNPKPIIDACRSAGILVFCDVSTMEYAEKTARQKPDALIAITNEAGGHTGVLSPQHLIPQLIQKFTDIPIIAAGGVGDYPSFQKLLQLGASGVSVGTVFIASEESPASEAYKNACVEYAAKDIVLTYKLSGIPCTIINTPYVQKTGTTASIFQRLIQKNRWFKKWLKALIYKRGMSLLEKAAFAHDYKTVWCAGTSIRFIDKIMPVQDIVRKIITPVPDSTHSNHKTTYQ